MLRGGFVHPSINCEDVHPEIAAYAASIPHVAREMPELRVAIKAGFGFGDVNACVVFRKWTGELARPDRRSEHDERRKIFETVVEDPHAVTRRTRRRSPASAMDTNILDDLKVNSARLVDVVLAFEDAFDIEIADEEVDNVNTVGDCVRLVIAKAS